MTHYCIKYEESKGNIAIKVLKFSHFCTILIRISSVSHIPVLMVSDVIGTLGLYPVCVYLYVCVKEFTLFSRDPTSTTT